MPPQFRRRPLQRLQQVRREPQQLRRQQLPDLAGQGAVQGLRGHHQHRRAGHRVPRGASGVQQGRQCGTAAPKIHPHPDQLAAQTVAGRRPEHHRQNQIGRGCGDQQHFCGHICVKDTPDHRHAAACQQSQSQHAPGHGAGHGEQQQRQPQQPRLGAKGDHGKKDPCRQLHREKAQKTAPRQEYRHGIGPAQDCPQSVAPPAQSHPRQAPGAKQQQIVHQGIQHKHTVHIYHRHGAASLHHGLHYRTAPPGKAVAKRRRAFFKAASCPFCRMPPDGVRHHSGLLPQDRWILCGSAKRYQWARRC